MKQDSEPNKQFQNTYGLEYGIQKASTSKERSGYWELLFHSSYMITQYTSNLPPSPHAPVVYFPIPLQVISLPYPDLSNY